MTEAARERRYAQTPEDAPAFRGLGCTLDERSWWLPQGRRARLPAMPTAGTEPVLSLPRVVAHDLKHLPYPVVGNSEFWSYKSGGFRATGWMRLPPL